MTHNERQPPPDSSARRQALKLIGGAAVYAMAQNVNAAGAPAPEPVPRRPIPRSGEMLPVMGLGTWRTFDVGPNAPERTELKGVLRALVAGGASVIDSSPMYGAAERVVGDLSAELGIREKLFFATKVWTSGRAAGIRQMEDSLRLMRTNSMDLMQVHNLLDLETHLKTLREWKAGGKIRYLGITHYHEGAHGEVERLVKTRDYDFVQINYSMDEPEAGARLLPACTDSGTAVLVNRPFAHAGLFGRVRAKPLPPWAADIDCTSWAQFFLKWILAVPAVTCVIPGTRRVAHMNDNLAAARGRLPDAAMRKRMFDYLQNL